MKSIWIKLIMTPATDKIAPRTLSNLKDLGGLKYREIAELPEFAGVEMSSFGALYRYEKSRHPDLYIFTSTVPIIRRVDL